MDTALKSETKRRDLQSAWVWFATASAMAILLAVALGYGRPDARATGLSSTHGPALTLAATHQQNVGGAGVIRVSR